MTSRIDGFSAAIIPHPKVLLVMWEGFQSGKMWGTIISKDKLVLVILKMIAIIQMFEVFFFFNNNRFI